MRGRRAEFDLWPPSYRPDRAWVFAHNEIVVRARPQRAWTSLIDATGWPTWYVNARRVRILGPEDRLRYGVRFRWVTFGTTVTSTVDLFEPPSLIGWRWSGRGSAGYHVWVLCPEGEGTRIVTEETQVGPGPRLLRAALQPTLSLSHEVWLASLERTISRRPS
jgi:hypothetical protein